jgi:hypothetical protein
MQKITLYSLLLFLSLSGKAQAQIDIGDSIRTHPSAILDINDSVAGNHRGVLFPRIPLRGPTDRTAIAAPDSFLLVFSPYTASTPYAGLTYWHNNRWNRFLNQTEVYDTISAMHLAQVVLLSELSKSETSNHVTDGSNKAPYKVALDRTIFDSQNAYNRTAHEYIIPEDGIYEIICKAMWEVSVVGQTSQIFIVANASIRTGDLVADSGTTANGSVVYVGKLNKGDRVWGAVGVGAWSKTPFKVLSASLAIVKY